MVNQKGNVSLIVAVLVLVGGLVGTVLYKQHQEKERRIAEILTSETLHALEQAWSQTLEYRNTELAQWDQQLNTALDHRFLPWYYSLFTRNYLEARAIGCKVASVWSECDAQKDLEKQVLGAFQMRVLEPAGTPSGMTRKLVSKYTASFASQMQAIPGKHAEISPERLQRFLSQTAVSLPMGEDNQLVSASMENLVQTQFSDDVLAQKMVENMLKDGLEGVSTQVTTHLAKKAFGSSAKYVLGPIVKASFLAWEYYDLKKEEASQRSVLQANISASFVGIEARVAEDAEKIMQQIETGIVQGLSHQNGLQVVHNGPALVLNRPAFAAEAVVEEPIVVQKVSAPLKERASESPYALQVASRKSYTAALELANELPDGDVIEKDVNGVTWYAVLSGGFETEKEVLAHKEYLLESYSHVGGAEDLPSAFVRAHPDLASESHV